MPQSTSTPPQPPSPAIPEWLISQLQYHAAWAENVTARYLTVAGATVDISRNDTITRAACNGCPWTRSSVDALNVHEQAQAHAEKCRALPRPAVTG